MSSRIDAYVPESLAGIGSAVRVKAGTELITQSCEAESLFLLKKGSCSVFMVLASGRSIVLRNVFPVSWIGEMELLEEKPAHMSVRADEDCVLISYPMDRARKLLLGDPEFLRNLCLTTMEKETQNRVKLICSETLPMKNRLAFYLLEHEDAGVVRVRKSQMASSLGATYRHIETLMKRFTESGALSKDGKTYKIMDRDYLEELSSDLADIESY
ncbi:MAG: cyclic nucleotide-binding domain-containing protein [Oscillospiraceae bacterium]|jgi:CRP/FNR family putative post-exponential-phase nitrogen-starvation transcriptional regulator